MRALAATIASLLLIVSPATEADEPKAAPGAKPMTSMNDARMVAPALEKYTQERVLGELWKRPGLSPRDRSIVTLAVLITRNQTIDMPYYLGLRSITASSRVSFPR